MQTFKLWLEEDPEIPLFKMLSYEKTDVEIRKVIENGIHPWEDRHANRTVPDKIVGLLNSEQSKIKELATLNYCEDMSNGPHEYYNTGLEKVECVLKRIRDNIRFVDNLSFLELLNLAKQQLREKWNHEVAKRLVHRACGDFNIIRSFIKSKDKKVKLASYRDIDAYDLGQVLTLDDFENNDRLLISEGLPVVNFRSTRFLQEITDSRGLLKLTDQIRHFELHPEDTYSMYNHNGLRYNGYYKPAKIRLIPYLTTDPVIRGKALAVAERWRQNKGTYCFTVDMLRLTEMINTNQFRILFPRLDYMRKTESAKSAAKIQKTQIQKYGIGRYPTYRCTGDTIKGILRNHNVSMTGTKDKLIEKLGRLAANLYRKHETEIHQYFRSRQFIKVKNGYGQECQQFPILQELDLTNLILTMYAIRHLRGNTILDRNYENDTFDLAQLSASLLNEEIKLDCGFLQICGE
jgi:hypothetical protein